MGYSHFFERERERRKEGVKKAREGVKKWEYFERERERRGGEKVGIMRRMSQYSHFFLRERERRKEGVKKRERV